MKMNLCEKVQNSGPGDGPRTLPSEAVFGTFWGHPQDSSRILYEYVTTTILGNTFGDVRSKVIQQ